MTIKKVLVLFLVLIFSLQWTFALTTQEIWQKYSRILDNYELKLTDTRFLKLLNAVDVKIDTYLKKVGLSDSKKALLLVLKEENAKRKSESNIVSDSDIPSDTLSIWVNTFSSQKIVESSIRKSMLEEQSAKKDGDVIEAFEKAGYEILVVNDAFEFVDGKDIKKIQFSTYIPVNGANYSSLLRKNIFSKLWDVLIHDGLNYYIPKDSYSYTTKIAYSESSSVFQDIITKTQNVVQENDVYYTYTYEKFLYFKDKYWFYNDELQANNITPSASVLLVDESRFKIITQYEKKRLISHSLIEDIDDKDWFLSVLVKDAGYTKSNNNDALFSQLKSQTIALTRNTSDTQKIELIYDYVLDNHYYYEDFTDGTNEIFSWIDTYKNGFGVCDGYSKLMYYMLAFAGIKDIEHIRWYVIDAVDFPEIWHAWIRIWNYYYDPTFDDPIGQASTLRRDQYRYYKLPRDLAYTNRIDGFVIDEDIKKMSLSEREKLVEANLFGLLNQYEINSYNLLKPFKVKQDLGVWAWESITLATLKKELPYYQVSANFTFQDEKWNTKRISQLKYYIPTDENILSIVNLLWEDFTKTVLLKWDLWNWDSEYRLAYEFVAR